MSYFMRGLKRKIRRKARRFPDLIDTTGLEEMNRFEPFDDAYTAPLHGFKDAAHYYRRCSSAQFLENIRIPTLIVQARNDPFLPHSCYPLTAAARNPVLFLEIPDYGGHVGFMGNLCEPYYFSEKRAGEFLEFIMSGPCR